VAQTDLPHPEERSQSGGNGVRGKWGQSKLSCCARALSGNRAASANPIQRGGDVFRVRGGELDLPQPGLPIPSVMDHQILAGILAAGLVGVAILSVRPGAGYRPACATISRPSKRAYRRSSG
jgi:hypothetical protein